MTKIEKVWFDENRIYLKTDQGEEQSRPLEAFPILKDATFLAQTSRRGQGQEKRKLGQASLYHVWLTDYQT